MDFYHPLRRAARFCTMLGLVEGVERFLHDPPWWITIPVFLIVAAIAEWRFLGKLDLVSTFGRRPHA